MIITNLCLKEEELELITRSYYCLKKVSVNRIGDLTSMTEEEVLNIRNLGRKSFQTIIRSLEEFIFHLNIEKSLNEMLILYNDDYENQ